MSARNLYLIRCEHFLELAEDRHDLDSFNYWYAERERVKRDIEIEREQCQEK